MIAVLLTLTYDLRLYLSLISIPVINGQLHNALSQDRSLAVHV